MKEKLTGLIAAPHTPFDAKGEIMFDQIPKQIEALRKQNVKGVYINGTTGEGLHMSVEERKAVTEIWCKEATDMSITVHVGALSIKDAVELSAHAQEQKAFATSAIAPCFFKPAGVQGLVDYCREITEAAPELPFYYYHSPGMTGVGTSMVEFLKEGIKVMPNLAGVKFNHVDLYEYQNCLNLENGYFDIPFGVDEFLLGALALGAKGAVGSTYNYNGIANNKIIAAFENGDIATAQELMKGTCQIVDLLVKYGGVAAGKVMMELHGVNAGDPRKPIRSLTESEKQAIREGIKQISCIEATI